MSVEARQQPLRKGAQSSSRPPAPHPPGKQADDGEIRLRDVQRLELKPGDILVVRGEYIRTSQIAEKIEQQLKELFPGHRVVVLAPGTELSVIGDALIPPELKPNLLERM